MNEKRKSAEALLEEVMLAAIENLQSCEQSLMIFFGRTKENPRGAMTVMEHAASAPGEAPPAGWQRRLLDQARAGYRMNIPVDVPCGSKGPAGKRCQMLAGHGGMCGAAGRQETAGPDEGETSA